MSSIAKKCHSISITSQFIPIYNDHKIHDKFFDLPQSCQGSKKLLCPNSAYVNKIFCHN